MERDLLSSYNVVKAVCGFIVEAYPSVKWTFFSGEGIARGGRKRKRRRSLVRSIGTFLRWLPPAPRIHINVLGLAQSRSYLTPFGSFYEDDYLPPMRRTPDESSLCVRSIFGYGTPQMSSTPAETHRAKISHLEKQLHDLQQQVAHILEQMPTSDYGSMVSVWLANQPLTVASISPSPQTLLKTPPAAPPPPLPPPPPPMPPQDFLQSTPVARFRKQNRTGTQQISPPAKRSPAALLSDVIKQITNERPRLKPVKRSPGGTNPLRTPKVVPDPADILTEVLRRRFAALHSNTDTDAGTEAEADEEGETETSNYNDCGMGVGKSMFEADTTIVMLSSPASAV